MNRFPNSKADALELVNPRFSSGNGYHLPVHDHSKHKHILDMIQLDISPSPAVQEAMATATPLNLYPTRNAMQRHLELELEKYSGLSHEHAANSIVLTHGSDNGLHLVLRLFSNPNKPVLATRPTYPHFHVFARPYYSDIIDVPILTPLDDEQGEVRYAAIRDACKLYAPLLCYLVSPNLPLGYILQREYVQLLADQFPNTVFLIDEAYFEFSPRDTCAQATTTFENILVTRTFSKFFAMPAERLGWIVAHPRVAEKLRDHSNDKDVTERSKRLGLAALQSREHYERQCEDIRQGRQLVEDSIARSITTNSNALIYGVNFRHGPFFTLLAHDPQAVVDTFRNEGIVVRNKNDDVPGGVRVCFASLATTQAVVDVCCRVNSPRTTWDRDAAMTNCKFVLIDLDKTLRPTSHPDGNPTHAREILEQIRARGKNVQIVTNNTIHDPRHLENIYGVPVVTPLSRFAQLVDPACNIYVVGNSVCHETLRRQGFNTWDRNKRTDVVLIASCFDVSASTWHDLSMAIGRDRAQVLVVEDNVAVCDWDCSELPLEACNGLVLPDMGYLAETILRTWAVECKVIGKPSRHMLPPEVGGRDAVVIGDSIADLELASNLNSPIIWINRQKKEGYDPESRAFVLNSLMRIVEAD